MSFASLFFFVRKWKNGALFKVNCTVVVTKHVWPYFQSRFPKTSSERVSSSRPILFHVISRSWRNGDGRNIFFVETWSFQHGINSGWIPPRYGNNVFISNWEPIHCSGWNRHMEKVLILGWWRRDTPTIMFDNFRSHNFSSDKTQI